MSEALQKIHHITLNVNDIKQATNWYLTSFNCELVQQDEKRAMLRFENIVLSLVLPSQEQPHLAFEKADADTYGKLKVRPEGLESCYVSDPGGNLIEIGTKCS